MEDALVRSIRHHHQTCGTRLNPCCNGRCTRTIKKNRVEDPKNVLILVVMEDALVQTAARILS
mgnify:CR=1 FL=1